MALIPRKTYPELTALSVPVQDADVLAAYRSPGPLRRFTASDLSDYIVQESLAFEQAGDGAEARTAQDKMRETVSVKDYGAIGDGTLHTVAEWIGVGQRFATLADLQAAYPHVTSTSDPLDWAAIQAAADYCVSVGGILNINATSTSYRTDGKTCDLSDIYHVIGKGAIIKGLFSGIPAVIIGRDLTAQLIIRGSYWIEVENTVASAVDGTWGIKVLGLRSSEVTFEAIGFDDALYFDGASGARRNWYGNTFNMLRSYNCGTMAHIALSDPSDGGDNYFNWNLFTGGSYYLGSGTKKAARAAVKLVVAAGSHSQAVNNRVAVGLDLDGGSYHASSAVMLYSSNGSTTFSHSFDFTGSTVETYGVFATIPMLMLCPATASANSRTELTGTVQKLLSTTWAIDLGELTNNTFDLRTQSPFTPGNTILTQRTTPLRPEVYQVNGSCFVTNRILWDTNWLTPATSITTGVSSRTTRATNGKLLSASAGVGFGLRWKRTTGQPTLIKLPRQQRTVLICYDASGNVLSGTSPRYAMGQSSRAFTVFGQSVYQGNTDCWWIHPDVAYFDLITASWTSSQVVLSDIQEFDNLVGDPLILDVSTIPQGGTATNIPRIAGPCMVSTSAVIQSFLGAGTDYTGTTNNGYRTEASVLTALSVAAVSTDTTVTVSSATGIVAGQVIAIELDAVLTGDERQWHLTTVNGAPVGNVVTLTVAIPAAAAIGRSVRTQTITAK